MSHDPAVGINRVQPFVVKAMSDPDPTVSRYAAEFFAKIAREGVTNTSGY